MSVVVCRRTRDADPDSLDSDAEVMQEVYEWDPADQTTGAIFLVLFQSRLFKQTLVGFLESQREHIVARFPDEPIPTKASWDSNLADSIFMKCFAAGVFRFKAVTEFLTKESPDGYRYEINVLKLNHSDGIPIMRPKRLTTKELSSLVSVERVISPAPRAGDYTSIMPGHGDPTPHNVGLNMAPLSITALNSTGAGTAVGRH